ncbi:hypothetical protein [Brevundimonas sp.]|uniref:hypothetical protein n=1 Tax=Brevundimonas sp. TaxID=1871086 RepID=UPI002D6F422E|nr:hypothetical protein [Brevundimonas sp.]HYC68223.1 hypothetical protein [Brevundimonas sp.]
MGMTEQVTRDVEGTTRQDDDLADVELIIRRARAGDLTENEAFEDIDRIVRRRDPIEIYQKSWG